MLDPSRAFSRTRFPGYTHAQIDTHHAQYQVYPPEPYHVIPDDLAQLTPPKQQNVEDNFIKAAKFPHENVYEFDTARPTFGEHAEIQQAGSMYNRLKDAGPPLSPRWVRTHRFLEEQHWTNSKRRKVIPAHTPLMRSPRGPLKQNYDTAVDPALGSKGFSVASVYSPVVNDTRENGHHNHKCIPPPPPQPGGNVHQYIPPPPPQPEGFERWLLENKRKQQVTPVHQQKGMEFQNSMLTGGLSQAQAHQLREIRDGQNGQRLFANLPPHMIEQQQQMSQQPGDPRHDAAPTHLQAQQYQQMLMQQRQAVAMRRARPSRFVENGLLPPASSFYPEWGFGRDSNMLPSPSTSQTPVDPNGPSFAHNDAAKRKRKTSDQDDMPVQPDDGRCVSPRTFKNTRILCSVYRFPQGRVQSTISEDHTTNLSKRRKLNFMALEQSKSYGATTKQHPRRDAEPNGRMSALIRA